MSGYSLRLLRMLPRSGARPSRAPVHHPLRQRARAFSSTLPWQVVKTHRLTDIGEGTKEVQLIQWYVEEGAKVEEWAKLCEVQSDKATVDISAQYSGVVKKLYFEPDKIIQVGDAILDIEVEGAEEEEPTEEQEVANQGEAEVAKAEQVAEDGTSQSSEPSKSSLPSSPARGPSKHASLATPAVRGLLKEHDIKIEDIEGTGKEGRVLKEDVHNFLTDRDARPAFQAPEITKPSVHSKQVETAQKLTPIQNQMFKAMTASLSIPHFLYSESVNITSLSTLRNKINATRNPESTPKLSFLPFIIKAVSLALNNYPVLNARVDTKSDPSKPQLIMRTNHNIGVAMDTPNGLIVPVIKSVNARSIISIATELQRLVQLGQSGKLSSADLSGGTITVSNIGGIGGDVVAPVLVEGQLAILGVGKIKAMPIFAADGKTVERAEMVGMSWSADHRVVDGATMARMARVVQGYLEEPGTMVLDMS